jgi:hypothetical protein
VMLTCKWTSTDNNKSCGSAINVENQFILVRLILSVLAFVDHKL